jgi:catechol 2,3-dioxygenase-like lactoylglutathione lyase family enzyme
MADLQPYVPSSEQLVVELFVRDISASKQFYVDLGFKIERDSGTFVVLKWEQHSFFLDERKDLPKEIPSKPQANVII